MDMKASPMWTRQVNKVVVGRDVRKAGDCACWAGAAWRVS